MYTKLFLDTLKKKNQYPDDKPRFSTTKSSKKALLYAARAQQYAAHSELVKGEMYEEHRNLLVKITKLRKEVMGASTPLEGGRPLSLLEQISAKLKEDDEDDHNDADYDSTEKKTRVQLHRLRKRLRYIYKYFFELSRELRATKVTMSVFAPRGSNGDYYVVFISIPDWHRFQHVLMPFDDLRICFEPPPIIKSPSEKAKGEKDPKDLAPGWSGRVMEDNALFQDAPLTALIKRPGEGLALSDMEMPSVNDVEQPMPTRAVYIKTFPSAIAVKARLKAIDKHTSSKNKSTGFDRKRRLLVGRDLSADDTVDLLHNIPQGKIEELTAKLNANRIQCFQTHCRQVPNGLNLIHGPFGSGKTVLVAMRCELQALTVPRSKTFIACSSNSACDAVVPKFTSTKSKLMMVGAHGLSFEREGWSVGDASLSSLI